MITFWIVAGLLIAAALLFVIPPLIGQEMRRETVATSELNLSIYRDQLRELDAELAAGTLDEAQYRNARNELEVRVIEDSSVPEAVLVSASGRWQALVVGLAVPLLAISLYMVLGNPKGFDPKVDEPKNASVASGSSHAISPEQIQAMTARLEQRLEQEPNDADGWAILARSYGALQRYEESAAAYARSLELQPNNAQLMADYADVLAMSNERSLQGEPEIIIQRALKADPNNLKALALAGTVAYERKDFQGAINHWQKILSLVPANSQIASSVNASLNDVRKLMGQAPVAVQQASSQAAGLAQSGAVAAATVSGTVSLSPALKSQVADTDTVFIFARAVNVKRGPPLAILRKTVKDLPISFTLDDSMAMAPSLNLSSASQVVIGARISRSGDAMPRQGDLEGYSPATLVGAKGANVTISATVN